MENPNDQQNSYIQGVIEALLFVNERPVTIDQIKKVISTVTPTEIKKALESLRADYASRQSGMTIVEIAEGFQMLSNPNYASYIREFYKSKHKERLSKPALETIAIIAYKQPVTRADIENIRSVNSDGVVNHLLDKELVKVVGRKDVPGKPYLYGTTRQFLEYFGLKSLDGLPKLEEFPNLQPAETAGILPIESTETEDPKSETVAEVQSQEAPAESEAVTAQESKQE